VIQGQIRLITNFTVQLKTILHLLDFAYNNHILYVNTLVS